MHQDHYIGCKQLQAVPASFGEYKARRGVAVDVAHRDDPGYIVTYPDGYVSWSPRDTFEAAYMPMRFGDPTRISKQMIDALLSRSVVDSVLLGNKTTTVTVILPNGFELTESSSCVDPDNYDHELGAELALKKIKNKLFELLGFTLQWAQNGQ